MLLVQAAHSSALSAAHADTEGLRIALAAAESAIQDAAARAAASAQAEAAAKERIAVLEANLSALLTSPSRKLLQMLGGFLMHKVLHTERTTTL